MRKIKVLSLLVAGTMLLPLAACSGKGKTKPTDKKIVLSNLPTDPKTTEQKETKPYDFKPLKYSLIRNYVKDQDGDNFPFLQTKMLKDSDVYQYPEEHTKVLAKVKKDDKIYLIQNLANGWSFIHHGKDSGYVKTDVTDQEPIKGLKAKNPKTVLEGEMKVKQPCDQVINKDNFKSTGKREPNMVYWKNFKFPFEKVSDFSLYSNDIFYKEPASDMIYKMIGPEFSPYDGKLTYLDGHRHRVAYNMWVNKFGKGDVFEITDKDGNAYKYKVVDAKQEQYSKYNAYIGACFDNGTSVVDALYFGTNYEGVVIQYCNDATTDPVINFFLCLPVLEEKPAATTTK